MAKPKIDEIPIDNFEPTTIPLRQQLGSQPFTGYTP